MAACVCGGGWTVWCGCVFRIVFGVCGCVCGIGALCFCGYGCVCVVHRVNIEYILATRTASHHETICHLKGRLGSMVRGTRVRLLVPV